MKPALLTFDPGGSTNPGAPSRFATLPASSSVLMTLVVLTHDASACSASSPSSGAARVSVCRLRGLCMDTPRLDRGPRAERMGLGRLEEWPRLEPWRRDLWRRQRLRSVHTQHAALLTPSNDTAQVLTTWAHATTIAHR